MHRNSVCGLRQQSADWTDAAEGLEKKCTWLLTPEKMLGVRSMRMMCSIRIAYRWTKLIARWIFQAVQIDGLSRAVTVAWLTNSFYIQCLPSWVWASCCFVSLGPKIIRRKKKNKKSRVSGTCKETQYFLPNHKQPPLQAFRESAFLFFLLNLAAFLLKWFGFLLAEKLCEYYIGISSVWQFRDTLMKCHLPETGHS